MNYEPKRDHYCTLVIDVDASPEEVKAAYRARAKIFHTDTSSNPTLPNPEMDAEFRAVRAAYDVLRNQAARRRYDEARAAHFLKAFEPEIQRRAADLATKTLLTLQQQAMSAPAARRGRWAAGCTSNGGGRDGAEQAAGGRGHYAGRGHGTNPKR